MVHKVVIQKRAYNQFQRICDYLVDEFGERTADAIPSKYSYRSKIVGEHNKLYYFVYQNTLVIAAFADMRMHPDNVIKAVIGKTNGT